MVVFCLRVFFDRQPSPSHGYDWLFKKRKKDRIRAHRRDNKRGERAGRERGKKGGRKKFSQSRVGGVGRRSIAGVESYIGGEGRLALEAWPNLSASRNRRCPWGNLFSKGVVYRTQLFGGDSP